MPNNVSARHALPYLIAGQAQKELTHNEALAIIDVLLHAAFEDQLASPPIGLVNSDAGKCWLVANGPQGDAEGEWAGYTDHIACWTGSGWRFAPPVTGMKIWHKNNSAQWLYIGGQWTGPATVPDASNGSIVDSEARNSLNMLLQRLREVGLLAV